MATWTRVQLIVLLIKFHTVPLADPTGVRVLAVQFLSFSCSFWKIPCVFGFWSGVFVLRLGIPDPPLSSVEYSEEIKSNHQAA